MTTIECDVDVDEKADHDYEFVSRANIEGGDSHLARARVLTFPNQQENRLKQYFRGELFLT